MRHLAAMGYVKQVSANEYQPTNFTKSMSVPIIGDGYLAMYVCTKALGYWEKAKIILRLGPHARVLALFDSTSIRESEALRTPRMPKTQP